MNHSTGDLEYTALAMARLEDVRPGTVTWVDVQTPDLERARNFYGELFDWSFPGAGDPEAGYIFAELGGRKAAGMAKLGPGAKVPPMWSVYLATDDADATARAALQAGGRALVTPMDVTDQGRMAYFADPTGALFGVWQGRAHRGAEVSGEPGAMAWHEVYSRDVGAALAFYGAVFDLESRRLDAPDIEYWTLHRGSQVVCGAMQMSSHFQPEAPSHWNTYFAVSGVDASVARLISLGGSVVAPAFDTPFGRLAFVADPFGAAFCLIHPIRLPGS